MSGRWITKADGNTWWASKTLEKREYRSSIYSNQSYGSYDYPFKQDNFRGGRLFLPLEHAAENEHGKVPDLST